MKKRMLILSFLLTLTMTTQTMEQPATKQLPSNTELKNNNAATATTVTITLQTDGFATPKRIESPLRQPAAPKKLRTKEQRDYNNYANLYYPWPGSVNVEYIEQPVSFTSQMTHIPETRDEFFNPSGVR